MWVKLLQHLKHDSGIITAGSVVWLRRAGKIENIGHSLVGPRFEQTCSVMTIENTRGLLMVLPDAEGALWEQTADPNG